MRRIAGLHGVEFLGRLGGVLIAFALFWPGGMARAEELKLSRGDLDGNGQIDLEDVAVAVAFMNGGTILDVIEAADVVDDGVIDRQDIAVMVHAALASEPVQFAVEWVFFERGDVNDDGVIDDEDARALDGYLRGEVGLRAPLDAADLDRDGTIDRGDLQRLEDLSFMLGDPDGEKPPPADGPHRIIDRLDGPDSLTFTGAPAGGDGKTGSEAVLDGSGSDGDSGGEKPVAGGELDGASAGESPSAQA